jgi:uncharacterized protein (TIGR03435 family)
MKRIFGVIVSAGLLSAAVFGQAATKPAAFDLVDVHTAAKTTLPFVTGGVLRGDRYVLRNATMVDLISAAYGVDNDKVVGGPTWLETDRFDIVAKAAPGTPEDALKLMLQAMLADRFKLAVHNETKSMPAFVLTAGKGKPKLKETEGKGSGCQPQQTAPNASGGPPLYVTVTCQNMTMDAFAKLLRQFAGAYLTSQVVDSTGIKGSWDFDLKWTPRGALAQAGGDGISIFDAVDRQLGLKLEPQKMDTPVITVDSVNEKPTDNPPGVTAALPPAPPAEFEVAVIKPSAPDATIGGRFDPNGQISMQAVTLKLLISIAWNMNPNDNQGIVGAPKWLDSDKFDIIAKTSTDPSGKAPPIDIEVLRQMLQALLIDRFQMKVHTEDRTVNAYTLLAANPKLKKADPANRTGCKEGPGPDGKDPRITNPILARLVNCQNITMAQFATQLQTMAGGYIFSPVQDATGLEGAWDFTLSFSTAGQVNGGRNLQGGGAAGAGGGGDGGGAGAGGVPAASDPSGALSIFDAINKQLGLRLEQRKRPMPVLVIDHIEEKPTAN